MFLRLCYCVYILCVLDPVSIDLLHIACFCAAMISAFVLCHCAILLYNCGDWQGIGVYCLDFVHARNGCTVDLWNFYELTLGFKENCQKKDKNSMLFLEWNR